MEQESPPLPLFEPLHESVKRILASYHGTEVAVERSELLTDPGRRNRLWRCHLIGLKEQVPTTVVIKQVAPDGYDPENVESWRTKRFFGDWAGARFLSECTLDEKHGPAFYGGDVELGFIVLEDMGEHTSLVEPLLNGDSTAASAALVAFARRLGRMHAASRGKEEHYRAIQREISSAWGESAVKSPEAVSLARSEAVTKFKEICVGLGIEPGAAAEQEFATAFQQFEEPGAFRTFIHSDPCPDNVFYRAPELRLIDFEFGCFGHALRDGLYGRLPFPTCWCANAVPPDVMSQMEDVYRAEFSVACREALDDQIFGREASVVAAYWAFNSLRWNLADAQVQDETWGIAGTRARILSRLLMFLDTAGKADQMPALCDLYKQALLELQSRWPEAAPLPLYPAFQGLTASGRAFA
jgi:hypothetical protein